MSDFRALEMSKEVLKHSQIKMRKGFLGLFSKAVYTPTESQVESYSNYYCKQDAEQIRDFINSSEQSLDGRIASFPKISNDPTSRFRLDLCISHDCRFLAMQLNHVADGIITHITPIRYFEGEQAIRVEDMF